MGSRLVFSIVDRLIAPGRRAAPRSLVELMETVRRDLEALLNMRRPRRGEFENFPNLDVSVRNLGLADFSAYDLRQPGVPEAVAASIAETIRLYEPRLGNVSVTVDDDLPPSNSALAVASFAFRIRAELRVSSVRERIRVKAVLDGGSGRLVPDRMVADA